MLIGLVAAEHQFLMCLDDDDNDIYIHTHREIEQLNELSVP